MIELKRLRLGKTTGWQHRFFDLSILSPIWLGPYEYMKSSLEIFFFGLKQSFQSGFFRFGQKFSNLTKFLCTPKNHFFEHFGGRQRLSGLQTLPKQVLKVNTPRKIEMAALAGPNCTERTLGPSCHATDPVVYFFCFETGLPEWIFQIWSKIVKSDRVFVYMKKSLF